MSWERSDDTYGGDGPRYPVLAFRRAAPSRRRVFTIGMDYDGDVIEFWSEDIDDFPDVDPADITWLIEAHAEYRKARAEFYA